MPTPSDADPIPDSGPLSGHCESPDGWAGRRTNRWNARFEPPLNEHDSDGEEMDLTEANAEMHRRIEARQAAGVATAVASGGDVVESCYGMLDVERGVPVQPDSLMRIHSMTKPVIAVAVMLLRERGLLNLDDPVRDWIPSFGDLHMITEEQLDTDITARHLLTHTAGLANWWEEGAAQDACREANLLSPLARLNNSLPTTVEMISRLPLAFQPGTCWQYSLSFDVLGYLIELISKRPLGEFCARRSSHLSAWSTPVSACQRPGWIGLDRCTAHWKTVCFQSSIRGSEARSPTCPWDRPAAAGWCRPFETIYASAACSPQAEPWTELTFCSPRACRRWPPTSCTAVRSRSAGTASLMRALATVSGSGSAWESVRFGWGGAAGSQMWIFPDHDLIVVAMTQSMFDFTVTNAFIEVIIRSGLGLDAPRPVW